MRRRRTSLWRTWRDRKLSLYERYLAEQLRRSKEHGRLMNRAESLQAESRRDSWSRF